MRTSDKVLKVVEIILATGFISLIIYTGIQLAINSDLIGIV